MEILDLSQRPDLLPRLGAWHWAQWGYMNPGQDLEAVIGALTEHLGPAPIPVTYIALEHDVLLGSASLIAHDMTTRPELTPWLASLYVHPPFRRRGIGEALMRRVVRRAAELSIGTLYLFTPDRQAYYAKRGWVVLEEVVYKGFRETIMCIAPRARD